MRFISWGLGIRLAMQTPEIVIATPERLCQLLSLSALNLSAVSYVVSERSFYSVKLSNSCIERAQCTS